MNIYNWRTIVGIIAGLVSILGFMPYLITIFQGKTRPNRASWWIWGVLSLILGLTYYSSGARDTIWVPAFYAIFQMIIAIVSIKHGEGGWNQFDRTCLLGAGGSLLFWWWFNSALLAIMINLTIDSLGALPTIKKCIFKPESEDLLSWALFFTANTLNLVAIEHWSVELLTYPLYLFCLSGIIFILLLLPKITLQLRQGRKRKNSMFR